jgi:hypothetical protein
MSHSDMTQYNPIFFIMFVVAIVAVMGVLWLAHKMTKDE